MSPLWFPMTSVLSAILFVSSASGSATILARALPQLRAFSLFAQDAHWQVTGPCLASCIHCLATSTILRRATRML